MMNQLEQIRQASNVVQALENLIIQCDEAVIFHRIKYYAEDALTQAEQLLRNLIHGG